MRGTLKQLALPLREAYESFRRRAEELGAVCTETACGVSAVFCGEGRRVLIAATLADPVLTAISDSAHGELTLTGDEAALKAVSHGTYIESACERAVIVGSAGNGKVSARLICPVAEDATVQAHETSAGTVFSPVAGYDTLATGMAGGALVAARTPAAVLLALAEAVAECPVVPQVELLLTRDISREGITCDRARCAVCVGVTDGALGGGSVVRVKDRRFSPDAELWRQVYDAGLSAETMISTRAYGEGSSMGAEVQRRGLPTSQIDVPAAYTGLPWETVSERDISSAAGVLYAFCRGKA